MPNYFNRGLGFVPQVSPGVAGSVLTSNGKNWAPAQVSFSFISSVAALNSSSVEIAISQTTLFDDYLIVFSNLRANSQGPLVARFRIGGVLQGSNYRFATNTNNANAAYTLESTNSGSIAMTASLSVSASADFRTQGQVWFNSPTATDQVKMINFETAFIDGSSSPHSAVGMGSYTGSTAALTAIEFYFVGVTMVSGNFRLYGIKRT